MAIPAWRSAWLRFTAFGIALAVAPVSLAIWTTPTVGVYDENSVATNTIEVEAGGTNSVSLSSFTSLVQTAFNENRGGVVNFDQGTYEADADAGVANAARAFTLEASYGVAQGSSISFNTPGVTNPTSPEGFNPSDASVPISGNSGMGIFNATGITFNPSSPLSHVAFTALARADSGGTNRVATLIATLADTTTIQTNSGDVTANGTQDVFFALAAPSTSNPIVSFRLDQNAFIRWDDLGFIAVGAGPGDVDLDGDVDINDYIIIRNNLGEAGTLTTGDIDTDGVVGLSDFRIWKEAFPGNANAAIAALNAVPEPASWLLLASGSAIALAYRHRRRF